MRLIASTLLLALAATVPVMTLTAAETTRPVVRLQSDPGQVRSLQEALNRQGFSAGQVDGLWGPNTAAALKRFQTSTGLTATGHFDPTTSAALGLSAGSSPISGAVLPRQTSTPGMISPGAATLNRAPRETADSPLATSSDAQTPGPQHPVSAAAGNGNQAVATTNANSPQPAPGANSFSLSEAQRRIERNGFQVVSGLHKDGSGIWRGTASKSGQQLQVWLDYKGNVGQQ